MKNVRIPDMHTSSLMGCQIERVMGSTVKMEISIILGIWMHHLIIITILIVNKVLHLMSYNRKHYGSLLVFMQIILLRDNKTAVW